MAKRIRTKEYIAWINMKDRCHNKNHKAFKNYGARGICVCERWINSFDNFLKDVGLAPSGKHSLDRYPNNNGNYEPKNVRWATASEQVTNRRQKIGFFKERISKELGGSPSLVSQRLKYGWPLNEAISTPVLRSRRES